MSQGAAKIVPIEKGTDIGMSDIKEVDESKEDTNMNDNSGDVGGGGGKSFFSSRGKYKRGDEGDKKVSDKPLPRRSSLASRALRAARQAIILRRSYLWQEGKDADIYASFCPSFLLEQLKKKKVLEPHTFFGKGACLIADISGFVKLCGRLSALGVNGIDDLQKCTNSYIGGMVKTVYCFGGDGE